MRALGKSLGSATLQILWGSLSSAREVASAN